MNWLGRLLHKFPAESELDKELRFHLEQQIADGVAKGLSPEEARRRSQQEFGGLERVREEVRDTRWETHLDNLFRDFRYAFRNLRKDRRFALVSIFTLALGIGATTAIFSVIHGALLSPYPYKNAERLASFTFFPPISSAPGAFPLQLSSISSSRTIPSTICSVSSTERSASPTAMARTNSRAARLAIVRLRHIGGLGTCKILHNVKFNRIAFAKHFGALSDDVGEINKYVRAIIAPDESAAFCLIKPPYKTSDSRFVPRSHACPLSGAG